MAKPNRDLIIDELVDFIDFIGVDRERALKSVCEKWGVAPRTFDRYWDAAKKIRNLEQDEIKAAVTEAKKEMYIEAARSRVMDKIERMEVLSQIGRGELEMTKHIVADGVIHEYEVEPAWADRKAAIAELNKMDGEYAPIRKETKHSGEMTVKQDLSALTTAELLERARAVKNLE